MYKILFFAVAISCFASLSQAQSVYQTTFTTGIVATDLETGASVQILQQGLDYPGGMWVDTESNTLYWADLFSQTLMSGNEDGSGVYSIANSVEQKIGWPTDLWVDKTTSVVYATIREGSDSNKESGLFSMTLDGVIIDTLLTEEDGLDTPEAFAVDEANKVMYVADSWHGLFKVNYENGIGSEPQKLSSDEFRGVALDPANDMLYLLTEYNNEIIKMNVDGTNPEVLVAEGFAHGNHIKLDLQAGKMVWTSSGDEWEEIPSQVQVANLDGTGVEVIYSETSAKPAGLFIDQQNSQIYVTNIDYSSSTGMSDTGMAEVAKMNMDGTNYTLLFDLANTGVNRPKKMVHDESTNTIYWSEGQNSNYRIRTMNLDENSSSDLILTGENTISAVQVDPENSRLFWSTRDKDEATLFSANLDGSNAEIIEQTSSNSTTRIRAIYYVNDMNSLFWAVDGGIHNSGVYKMSMDDMTPEKIDESDSVYFITYSASADKLFLYEPTAISKLNTDGSGLEKILDLFTQPGGLAIDGESIYWGDYSGLYRSDFAGNDSTLVSEEVSFESGGSFFFGSEILNTSTEENRMSTVPSGIRLHQNYPNPFNPSTTIQYSLSQNSEISIELFNLLGKKVATIYEGQQTRGDHSIHFNAQTLSSGVYFYRLRTESMSQTEKMTLIK